MKTIHKKDFPIEELIVWFESAKREFAWRQTEDPYAIWVSEIMLQQTRASVVIEYFKRWMKKFPTLTALANSPLEEVIKQWEGLGYYTRAKFLHEGAKYVKTHHEGKLPDQIELLAKIKGIGPYTQGAILSFAFHKRAAAVDGNVARVISRFYAIEEPVNTVKTFKLLSSIVEQLLPKERPWVGMEALIELGALVCTKTPACQKCPLQKGCLAFHLEKTHALPIKKKLPPLVKVERNVFVIRYQEEVLIQKPKGKGVMGALYQFPFVEKTESIQDFYPEAHFCKTLFEVVHFFTNVQAKLFIFLYKVDKKKEIEGYSWVLQKECALLPFSSGHRKIIKQLEEGDEDFTYGEL